MPTDDSNSHGSRLIELFEQLLERPPGERRALASSLSGGDEGLESELLELLREHEDEDDLPPALDPSTGNFPLPSEPVEPAAAEPGREIGHYVLVRKLGEGGMGTVYLARQQQPVKRDVALKLLRSDFASPEVIARFEAERQALAVMDHPNIAKVFDGGLTEAGRPYFVMEYVDGETITDYCDRLKLGLADRLRLFTKVCGAIQHAHQKGVIHRDIKPSNVLVAANDAAAEPKVIDFGIAKAIDARLTEETLYTAHGMLVGTPEYMSPEQAQGGPFGIDTRTDVYSLGVLLYKMLVGRLPFGAETRTAGLSELLRVLATEEPPRPSTRLSSLDAAEQRSVARERSASESQIRRELGRDLDWIVLRAMEKDRERRYPSASELAEDVQRYLRSEPLVAGPPSVQYRVGKFLRRHRVGASAAALVIAVLLTSAVALSVQAARLERALADSQRQSQRAETVSSFLVDLFRRADPGKTRGDEVTAREVLDQGIERIDSELADEPELQARMLTTMGEVYNGLGLWETSKELHERAHEMLQILGPQADAELRATTLGGLGWAEARLGEFEPAERHIAESVALREATGGISGTSVAEGLMDLCRGAFMRGAWSRAEEHCAAGLDVLEQSGADPSELEVSLLGNLGAARLRQNRHAEAEPPLRRGLELVAEYFPDQVRSRFALQQSLVHVLRIAGEVDRALDLARANQALGLETWGESHPWTISSYAVLSRAADAAGDFDAALEAMTRNHELVERRFGPEAPQAIVAATNWGVTHGAAGRWQDCVDILEDVVDRTTGSEVELLIATRQNAQSVLGHCLSRIGELEEGERTLRASLQAAGQPKTFGARVRSYLAHNLLLQGRPEEAGPFLDEAGELLTSGEAAGEPIDPEFWRDLWSFRALFAEAVGDVEMEREARERLQALSRSPSQAAAGR